jgi:hypothetical protein
MNISKYSIAVAAVMAIISWPAAAQDNTDCQKPGMQQKIEGHITNIDMSQGKVTVQSDNGQVHVFNAAQETLKTYKKGETIKMRLRCDK